MPDQSELAVLENEKHSIREFYPGTWGGLVGDGFGFWSPGLGNLLPPWGTPQCDRELRAFHYMLHNTLWQGAANIFSQKVLSTPFEMNGGRNQTYQWQDIFFEADFGEGYDFMMAKAIIDYLTLNRGFFLEKVSYGNPDEPLAEGARILALNHLDALRIVFSGNLEYPYVYYSEETNKAHRLHRSRVIHMTHSPSPNTRMFGMGKSPLYDSLSNVNTQILLGRHQNEMLSDMPPPGLILFTNVKGEDVENAMKMFEAQRKNEGQSVYRAPMRLEGKDPTQPVTVTFTPLAQVPTDFDREKYMRVDVNLQALALQLDPQDIWPLVSQAMGSGQQSKELAAKTEVKGPGYLLTRLERMWNTVTPRPLEWKYKAQNSQQDKVVADIAQTWTTIINSASFASEMEKRQLAANQIPAFADVLLDKQGNVRLPDDDPKVPGQEQVIADDIEQVETPATPVPDGQLPDETSADDTELIDKEYDATQSAFVSDLVSILKDAGDKIINKASFSARMRTAISKFGKAAYLDGLETGGVEADSLEGDDSDTFASLLAAQSTYVSDLASTIYAEDGTVSGGADFKAGLWANKTLAPFYQAGLVSADKNGLYQWKEGDTVDKCVDCLRMDGQKHRLYEYQDKNMMPPTSETECGGWQCKCSLEKDKGKTKGNW